MQLLDYVFVCSLNVVFVSLFARLDAKDVNMHPNHEYNCSGFKILTCSLRLVVTNGGSCILVVKMTGFDRANRNPTPSNVILFIYVYFIFGVFLPPSFFLFAPRLSFLSNFLPWGFWHLREGLCCYCSVVCCFHGAGWLWLLSRLRRCIYATELR